MAQEWYLLNSPHSLVSGFEDEALSNEGFMEMLDSDMAYDVELWSSDMSTCTPIRALIQNRIQDTKLKTMKRFALVPIGTCVAGQYIKYKDRFWLIENLVDDNQIYEKAILTICNWLMTWINASGKIIQRWAHIDSASQYNNGETDKKFYFIRSDQLMVYLPDDPESLMLDSGKRFIIDKRCRLYEKDIDEGTVKLVGKPLTIYDVTRRDSVLDDYQGSGLSGLLVTQTEQSADDGYYVVDGKGYWLAEALGENTQGSSTEGNKICKIDFETDEVLIDIEPSLFMAKFYDGDGNEVAATPEWSIDCDFVSDLNIERTDNSILISTECDDLRNKDFALTLSSDGYDPASITVHIREFI